MTDRELMQQALEALNRSDYLGWQFNIPIIKALRERLAKEDKNDFHPDWDTVKAYEDKFAEMLDEIQRLRAELEFATSDPIVGTKTWFNEEGKIVQQELKRSEVYKQPEDEPVVFNTISSLRHKKTVGPIESAMTGRPQTAVQPCAGRNCGSTNPNLHSAECFEDYEKSTGMREWKGLTEEEVMNCYMFWVVDLQDIMGFYKGVETKLKEKNT
jgi:hypothetical protein